MNAQYGNNGELYDSDLAGVSYLPYMLFYNNTLIETFNELGRYRSITSLGNSVFHGCSNLREISLVNILNFGASVF